MLVSDRFPLECKAYTVILLLLWTAFNLVYELSCLLPPESVDDDDDDSDFVLLDDDRLLKANPFPNKLIFLISFCGD